MPVAETEKVASKVRAAVLDSRGWVTGVGPAAPPGLPLGVPPGVVGPGGVVPAGMVAGMVAGMPLHRMAAGPMMDRDPNAMPRQTPYMGQPDIRIYELNKRLQQRTEESDNLWWDAFATEFFEDEATLTLSFCLEDGPKRYTIGRTLIPRYFRSIFEGGVTDLYLILKHAKESFHNATITLDCDQAMMITHHGKPMFTKVVSEGRLILEFSFDELMRIRSWHFATRQHRELIPRSVIAMQQDPAMVEQLSKNITRQGLTNYTLNFLRLCVILEPMQELMSRHKAYGLSPRDCLKTTLFQKWQRMVAPPETARQPSKRRKRKASSSANSAGNSGGGGTAAPPGGKQKRSPGPQGFNPMPGDVMVVGEPTLMGGEFGDEDERLITRLENAQYDSAAPPPPLPPNSSSSAAPTSGGGGGGGGDSGGAGDSATDEPVDQKNVVLVTPGAGGGGGGGSGGSGGAPQASGGSFPNSPSSTASASWGERKATPPTTTASPAAPVTADIKTE